MQLRTCIVSLALAGSLALVACGSSGDGDGLSRSELAKKANAICLEAATDGKAVRPPKSLADPKSASGYFEQVAPISHKQTRDLAALEPDKGTKEDWDAFVKAQEKVDGVVQTITKKAKARDTSGLKDLQRLGTVGLEADKAATKVGAKKCL